MVLTEGKRSVVSEGNGGHDVSQQTPIAALLIIRYVRLKMSDG